MSETIIPVLTATGLGALIGLERQFHQGLAGLRTNALVAAAAAAFVHLPVAAHVDIQPPSLAAAVISGIGFLGAGVILREGMNVRGLNTAATLWGSAAVGVYAGSDLLADAAGIAGVILAINILLRPVIAQLNRLSAYFSTGAPSSFTASLECDAADQGQVRAELIEHVRKAGLHLRGLRTTPVEGRPELLHLEFDVMGYGRVELPVELVMVSLGGLASISNIAWVRTEAPELDPSLHPSS